MKHENLSLCSGLGIYSDLQSRLLSPEQARRDSVALFQDFLSREFFAGESVILVPALKNADGSANDVVYINIGAESERPIHGLGDGMQSLIICTYPIVTEAQPGSLFFLEEPDLCMHPSLQRAFLDVLKSHHREKGHQFFITTHSNHLLDLVDDADLVSVFSFSAICKAEEGAALQPGSPPRFRIRAADRRDRDLLAQLGVRPSATFLSNATIWVEGVSDASYLRAYLGETLSISKYFRVGGSGTLPGAYKREWSSPAHGVPSKIRAALRGMPATEGAGVSDADLNQLPAYLTHDLLWLCARIYRHIAECNHHNEAGRQLHDFLIQIRTSHQGLPSSGSGAEGDHASSDGWPIHDPNDRRCFFAEVATTTPLESASPEQGGESA